MTMSYRRAVYFQDTNEKLVRDMVSYVENINRQELPYEAVVWVVEILQRSRPADDFRKSASSRSYNEEPEFLYSFSGETREKNKWKIEFVLNADVMIKGRNQYTYSDSDIYIMKKTFSTTDKRARNDQLQFTRPEAENVRSFKRFSTEKKDGCFRCGAYPNWHWASSNYV